MTNRRFSFSFSFSFARSHGYSLALCAALAAVACAAPTSVTHPEVPAEPPAGTVAKAPETPGPQTPSAPTAATSAETTPVPAAPSASPAASAPAPAPGALSVTQGKLPDAARALASAEALVHQCFQTAKAPPKSGNVAVKVTVATSGFSLNVTVKEAGDVDKATASCAKTVLRDASWGKPEGGGVAAVAGVIQAP
jgi:hypothetical protein